jgi:predicted acylesterase/phospholipase RssA
VLSLDGGGAKGFYTIGILAEIEAMTGRLICDSFDFIFGASAGAIIATCSYLSYYDLVIVEQPLCNQLRPRRFWRWCEEKNF